MLLQKWASVIASLFACWLCFLVLLLLFFITHNKPVPHWAFGWSVNSVGNILGRLVEISFASITWSTMNQLVHIWYSSRANIRDVNIFSHAARSPKGLIPLLRIQRGCGVASWLAISFLTSHMITTNIQQAISVVPESTPFKDGTVPIATRIHRPAISQDNVSSIDGDLLASIFGGLMGQDGDIFKIPARCDGGAISCNWESYSTIEAASKCEEISSNITTCGNTASPTCSHLLATEDGLPLMVGPNQLYTSVFFWNSTFFLDTPWYLSASRTMTLGLDGKAQAYQCVIFPQISQKTGSMVNQTFQEEAIAEPWHNQTKPLSSNPQWLMSPPNSNETFSIDQSTAMTMQYFFEIFFTANSTSLGNNTDFNGRFEHQFLYAAGLDGSLPDRFNNITRAMSKALRVGTPIDSLYGNPIAPATIASTTSYLEVQITRIEWFFLVPTALCIISITVLLFITISLSRKLKIGVHGGSILAYLNWAPADKSRVALQRDAGTSDLRQVQGAMFESRRYAGGLTRLQYLGGGRPRPPSLSQRWLKKLKKQRAASAANGGFQLDVRLASIMRSRRQERHETERT